MNGQCSKALCETSYKISLYPEVIISVGLEYMVRTDVYAPIIRMYAGDESTQQCPGMLFTEAAWNGFQERFSEIEDLICNHQQSPNSAMVMGEYTFIINNTINVELSTHKLKRPCICMMCRQHCQLNVSFDWKSYEQLKALTA